MSKHEIIVKVLAEGGSITLSGTRHRRGWIFTRATTDSTPELIDEENIFHESDQVNTWEAALQVLDK